MALLHAAGRCELLGRSPLVGRLTALHLTGGTIRDEDVAKLAGGPMAANLRTLRLGHNHLSDEAAVALADGGSPALTELVLAGNAVSDAGLWALPGAAFWNGLRSLDLSGNEITPSAAAAFRRDYGRRFDLLDLSGQRRPAGVGVPVRGVLMPMQS